MAKAFQPHAASPDIIHKVAIIGHSYVNRFHPLHHLPEHGITFRLFGKGGATVESLRGDRRLFDRFVRYQPTLSFLIIGGNDISADTVPRVLATNIEDLAKHIEDATGGYCIIIGTEKRLRPRNMSKEHYNRIRNAVNRNLRHRLPFAKKRFCSMEMSLDELTWDGVHIDGEGSKRLKEMLVKMAVEYFNKK